MTRADFSAEWDLRREPRLRVDRQVTLIPFGPRTGMRSCTARLLDCSRHGVGLLLTEPLLPGEQFMIRAKLREVVLLIYAVRNCCVLENGYRVGGLFSGIVGPPGERDASVTLQALLEGEDA